jgi:hypothetical protein
VVNMEARDGPSFSIGGDGSRRRPYVFRAGRGASGTSTGSDRSGNEDESAVRDDVDMVICYWSIVSTRRSVMRAYCRFGNWHSYEPV